MSNVSANITNWGAEIRDLAERLEVPETLLHAVAAAEVGELPARSAVGLPVVRFEVHRFIRRKAAPGVLELRKGDWSDWDYRAHWYRAAGQWRQVHMRPLKLYQAQDLADALELLGYQS